MDPSLPGTFVLNNTSLAQFSEMKAPVYQYTAHNPCCKLSPQTLSAHLAAGTPHGISDILGRPLPAPNGSLLAGYPSVGSFGGLGPQGMYYGPQATTVPKSCSEYPARGRACWADTRPDWRGGSPGRQCASDEYERYEEATKEMLSGVDYKAAETRKCIRKKLPNDEDAAPVVYLNATDTFRITT
ncbi:hypothetical protein NDU88_004033 [Pleurodeles waltl]|uniref:Uncharacterized protein n=1 Tax=Pleurodeles waltl TaxID=8319 RepID=A0AAV7LTI7_PLEWA|nr:hypothetical protein NDU88_004033 [Pleurodeles waltl]